MGHRSVMKKRILAAVAVFASISAAVVYAPDAVRWYIEDTYPDVDLHGDVHLVWGGVELTNVAVHRPGLDATLDRVHVSAEKRVTVRGGRVALNLDTLEGGEGQEGVPGGGHEGVSITASELNVEAKRGDIHARLTDVDVNPSRVCFRVGAVFRGDLLANVWQGCMPRDRSKLTAWRVEVPVKLPFDVPRVDTQQVVRVSNAEVVLADKLVRFASASMGPFTVIGPATVKLSDDTVFFDAPQISVDHPWVSPTLATFDHASLTAPLSLFQTGKGAFRVRIGNATIHLDPETHSVRGDEACGDWLDILPHPLPEAMDDMQEHFHGRLRFEVGAKPTPYLNIKHNCTYDCSAQPIADIRKGSTSYMAYGSDGSLFERRVGRNTPGWVRIADLPPHVPRAFILLEDPGFQSHHGIHVMALQNSLIANLEKGEFVKGGSTISMQLSKNLWLRRHKTVGRKAHEALLTVALESCLSKADILEWYVNVVEYGPDLYGLGPAAKHYFDKSAQNLEPDEAFYLASLLPRPSRAVPPKQGGLARAHRLMRMLARSGFISEHLIPIEPGEVNATGWEVNE